ncbi:MAG: hypothetical protein AAB650_01005 [Patescibacteria group bacterium]
MRVVDILISLLVFLLGAAVIWFLPGIVVATICLCSGQKRAAVLRLSRESLKRSVQKRFDEGVISEAMAERMLKRNQAVLSHLLAASFALIILGPGAIDWLRALRKQLPP